MHTATFMYNISDIAQSQRYSTRLNYSGDDVSNAPTSSVPGSLGEKLSDPNSMHINI